MPFSFPKSRVPLQVPHATSPRSADLIGTAPKSGETAPNALKIQLDWAEADR
jgi:hypothetical protein